MNDKTNNKWCVYKHTNLNNGKIYIGKTCRKPEYRWNLGKGYIAQPYFWNAIKKYGWENFSHEIIKTDLSADEATTLEKELICYHDSMNPEKGYNQTAGGEGMLGWKHTAESKRKIIESNKRRVISDLTKKKQSESHKGIYVGEKNPFYNKKHSAETKLKISIANKGKTHPVSEETRRKISISHMGIGHPISEETKRKISIANKGHVVSEETRKQISNRLSGKNNPMYGKISPTAKKLVQYDLLGTKIAEYNSATEALKITGISNTSIGECCKGKLNSAGGFVQRYENDEFNKFTTPQSFINNNRAIIQYDLQGNFIKRYSSITEIASVFGLNKYSILKVCKTKKGITLNSFWRFEGDDLPSAYKKCIKTRGILQYSKAPQPGL